MVKVHCDDNGSPKIERHVAFREYLLAHLPIADAYDEEKARCRNCHLVDSPAYTECKNDWIKRIERDAITWSRSRVAS